MSLNQIINLGKVLFSGVGVLLQIFIITLILSIPLGIIIAILRNSKCRIISFITRVYILIMRGTPIMLQIIVVYFAPYYLFKINYNNIIKFFIYLIILIK